MRLENGREYLYQWDKYQRVILDSKEDNMELHFACPCDGEDTALSVKPYVEDDIIYADIPNILLQRHGCINIYKYIDNGDVGYTYDHFMVGVRRREKPSDYVYIETEVLSYKALEKRIIDLEETGGNSIPGPSGDDSQKVLTANAAGAGEWKYPYIIDGTLTKGYRYVTANTGVKSQLVVIDIADPIIGMYTLPPDALLYVRIINGDKTLVASYGCAGSPRILELYRADSESVCFFVCSFMGTKIYYCYSVAENTWETSSAVYSAETIDHKLSDMDKDLTELSSALGAYVTEVAALIGGMEE